ncbi:MAG: prolipoprotein diacylglyceryl transferase [Luteibaculaceae bacterium]
MLPLQIIWDPNPEIFNIPSINLSLRWYGLLFVTGLLMAQQVMYKIYTLESRKKDDVDSLSFYIFIGVIIGARLGHVFFYQPDYYLANPSEIIMINKGGLASHGAAIGILLSAYIFSKVKKESFLWLIDRIVLVVPLAGGFVRLGNFANSEIIGNPTSLPWGIIFPQEDNIPRHPTQLYEALFYFMLFAVLFYFYKRNYKTVKTGKIFGIFLIALFGFRFVVEFLKEIQVNFEATMFLNMGQWLSVPFILAGIYLVSRKN